MGEACMARLYSDSVQALNRTTCHTRGVSPEGYLISVSDRMAKLFLYQAGQFIFVPGWLIIIYIEIVNSYLHQDGQFLFVSRLSIFVCVKMINFYFYIWAGLSFSFFLGMIINYHLYQDCQSS